MKNIIFFIVTIFIISQSFASEGYEYKVITRSNQKIHLIKIDLTQYNTSLVSAHNSVFGRERVGTIAERENADIAINAGFFHIGSNEDGRPTGTLVINGEIFGLRTSKHAVFVTRNNFPSVEIWEPKITIKIGQSKFIPDKYNKFAVNNSLILYSDKWGYSTLSSYKKRKEVLIPRNDKILSVENHGNTRIPLSGFVLSFPESQDISSLKINDEVDFNEEKYDILSPITSAVMGIPYLIMDGKINEKLLNDEKHARTAIGIDDESGTIIIVVAECNYKKPVSSLTLKEIQNIFQIDNISFNNLKANDIKKSLTKKLAKNSNVEGLGLRELAEIMLEQGCVSAINLDGGGSSSLYINGKYVNSPVGDKDEAEGVATSRPVSDAIIFKRK